MVCRSFSPISSYFILIALPDYDRYYYLGKTRGTRHDMISSYKHLIKKSRLFLSGGFTPEKAQKTVSSGEADVAVFGRLFISNPDLPKRVQKGIPLNLDLDLSTMYGPNEWDVEDPGELRKGYTDYPEAV
jgi:2,4-dienoyl-CoA reductase-like NADH-dependent reductase (Old Yellow Enzyme family)